MRYIVASQLDYNIYVKMKVEGQSKFTKFDLASNLLDMFHAGTGRLN